MYYWAIPEKSKQGRGEGIYGISRGIKEMKWHVAFPGVN